MIRQETEGLKQRLLNVGYDVKIVEMAIKYSKDGSEDSITDFIRKCNAAQSEAIRRKCVKSTEEIKNATNFGFAAKNNQNQRCFDKSNNGHVSNKKEMKIYQNTQIGTMIVREHVKQEDNTELRHDDCRIRVRFEEGESKLYLFNKNDSLENLFEEIRIRMKNKSFRVYTADYRKIEKSNSSFIQSGFYPSGSLFVKKKGFSFF